VAARASGGPTRRSAALGLQFEEIANPAAFARDPALAWGFYGHRLALYRRTVPHRGFALLREIAAGLPGGAFVFTSNVDGQFQKAGFAEARIMEVHGSIHHLQCQRGCRGEVCGRRKAFEPRVDEEACRLLGEPPRCPHCGDIARPNILMFGDWGWIARRTEVQEAALVGLAGACAQASGDRTRRRRERAHGAPLRRVDRRSAGAHQPAGRAEPPRGRRSPALRRARRHRRRPHTRLAPCRAPLTRRIRYAAFM
jgi:hypothetical protein